MSLSQRSLRLMGHLTFYTYNLGGPWLPVDHRGCGYWALKLRQIKWTFKDQQQDKGANELNFDAPLILDIGMLFEIYAQNLIHM